MSLLPDVSNFLVEANADLYEALPELLALVPSEYDEPDARRGSRTSPVARFPGIKAAHVNVMLDATWKYVRDALKDPTIVERVKLVLGAQYDTWVNFGEGRLKEWISKVTDPLTSNLSSAEWTDGVSVQSVVEQDGIPWIAADSVLAATLRAKAAARGVYDTNLSAYLLALSNGFQGKTLTRDWLVRNEQLTAFKLRVRFTRGLEHEVAWGVHAQSAAAVSWRPALLGQRAAILEDFAVPVPWQGRGFSRVLRALENAIADSPHVTLLLATHAHRSLLPLTIGTVPSRPTFGYREWRPFENKHTPALLAHMEQEGAARGIPTWQVPYTPRYSEEDLFPDAFHVFWTSPLGTLLEQLAANAIPTPPGSVPCSWFRGVFAERTLSVRNHVATIARILCSSDSKTSIRFGVQPHALFRLYCTVERHDDIVLFDMGVGREKPIIPDTFAKDASRPWLVTWLHILAALVRLIHSTVPVLFTVRGVRAPDIETRTNDLPSSQFVYEKGVHPVAVLVAPGSMLHVK